MFKQEEKNNANYFYFKKMMLIILINKKCLPQKSDIKYPGYHLNTASTASCKKSFATLLRQEIVHK